MEITIRNGKLEEINIAYDLLRNAATWLRDKNIDYWQNWHNPPAAHIEWIKNGFANGEFFFVYGNENMLVGMYRLQYSDDMFWGKRDDKAGYIHSLTTNRELRGQGIGYLILSAIERELSAKGFEYLRLDCSADVEGLCKYYEKFGFMPKEIITHIYGEKLRLYEKKINMNYQPESHTT